MLRRSHVLIALAGLSIAVLGRGAAIASPVDNGPAGQEAINLGLRGVYFVPNQGQWSDEEVHFGLKSRGLDVAFRTSELTMHLARQAGEPSPDREGVVWGVERPEARLHSAAPEIRGDEDSAPAWEHVTLSVTFPGSNEVLPVGAQPREAKFNYFVGGEGRGVASNVPSFGAVVYENLYDGVDLHVMGNDNGVLKYEFHVAPEADWSQIAIAYDGIDSLCIDDAGDLRVETSFGTLSDNAPVVWQEDTDASRTDIPARFELIDARTYRIALDGAVDPARPLVIDPDVEWMYYYGGTSSEHAQGIALDADGNLLVAGYTYSTDFYGRNNSHYGGIDPHDAFLVKASASGELIWMTYLGGTARDRAWAVAADSSGNALVTGETASDDFEGKTNSYMGGSRPYPYDAFVAKVSGLGRVRWMTYVGGTDGDIGWGIAADHAGNALLAGQTDSPDLEYRNNAPRGDTDAFVAKVDPEGTVRWTFYLGGRDRDFGRGIAVDSNGGALVTGWTPSEDFLGRTNSLFGSSDAFIARITPLGRMDWMRYLGGTDGDGAWGVAVHDTSSIVVTGNTKSHDFEARLNSSHGNDAFITLLNPQGEPVWMRYLGGWSVDVGRGVACSADGGITTVGYTSSPDFEGSINSFMGGSLLNYDAFAARLTEAGSLDWMMYLGGDNDDEARAVAADATGAPMVVGETYSFAFVGRRNTSHGSGEAFALRIRLGSYPALAVTASCPVGGPMAIEWSNATPDGQIALLFAREVGSFTIPNGRPCAGTTLGLGTNQIQIAFQGNAGPEGSRTLNASTGPGACGGYLQLLDLTTCGTSNVVLIE